MKSTFRLLLFLSLILAMGFPGVHCSGTERTEVPATRFFSDGDLISGWYWLRDPSFNQAAEWVFEGIPQGTEDIVLDLEVLATSRVDGPRGIDARFFLSYGIPPRGGQGGLIVGTKEVVLPNVSPPHDPVGYTCRGQVTIPRKNLEGASVLWIRAHRNPGPFLSGKSPSTVHVAFRKESVTLLLGEEMEETGGGFVEADADRREDAVLIAPGTVSGDLGYRRGDGSVDSADWYRFSAEQGQIITLSLTFPQGASFSLSLYPPGSTSSVGNVETRENTKSLEYVAGESGNWSVRIYRLRGAGEYHLNLAVANQNDAGSGRDAGNNRWDALRIGEGTFEGFLKSADSSDWYRFSVEKGQIITLSLTFPQGASFSFSLYPPSSTSSVGNVVTEGNTKSLEYVAGESGEWSVRIYRLRGEGGYILTIGTGGIVVSTPTPTRTPQPTPIHTPIHTPAPTPTLTPQPPPEITPPPDLSTPPPFAGYLITVVTGDKLGAGTDANVYLTLYGEKGNSTELFLDNPNRNDFERNQTDTFTIPPSQVGDLGAIRRIYLRHDNSGTAPGWYVASVTVTNIATGEKYRFIFNRWLATDEEDGALGALREGLPTTRQTFTPPYSDTRVWTHKVGNADCRAAANKASGGIAFYIDAWVGGSTATSGQSIWVSTSRPATLVVTPTIKYVGGTYNFSLASFSELELFCEVNGNLYRTSISPAFSGPVVFDKVLSLALLAAGGLAPQNARSIADLITTGYSLVQLSAALQQLEAAGNASTVRRSFTVEAQQGLNKISVGLRGNASGVATGSAFVIVGGQVTSIEVEGIP